MPQQQRLPFTRQQAADQDLARAAPNVVSTAPNPPIDNVVEEIERPASALPNANSSVENAVPLPPHKISPGLPGCIIIC